MSKELFNRVIRTLQKEGMNIEHEPNCSFEHIPLSKSPCSCLAYYWFLQGLHATSAECMIKFLSFTSEPNQATGIYRCNKMNGEWSNWETVNLPVSEGDEKGNS